VRPLDLFAGKSLDDVKVETNERECDADRLGTLIGMLRGKGVDDVLVNERRITMCDRVAAQFVVDVCVVVHGGGAFFERYDRSGSP
jgi:hypothetical protein